MTMSGKRKSLGKGLDALLGYSSSASAEGAAQSAGESLSPSTPSDGQLRQLPIEQLQRGKYQPRRDLDQEALAELAQSIKTQGVMQPIVVRAIASDRYEIIAGERRWRATQLAGLDTVPAIVREVPDEAAIAMALIENIQRENLNAIEESRALIRLQEEFALTQQQVAEAVGKSRSAVANLMRLAALEREVQTMLERGDLDLGHAKCLLALPSTQQVGAARTVVAKGLTVRQTERLVAQLINGTGSAAEPAKTGDIAQLERELSEKIGAPVALQHRANGGGKLVLSYASLDELDGILAHIH